MRILYYYWTENSADDMIATLCALGHSVVKISYPIKDYNNDSAFAEALRGILTKDSYDIIYSFDFFPIISVVAADMHIRYVSWIYDMPHNTLYSAVANNSNNYIFTFDRIMYDTICQLHPLAHIYHLPLAVNMTRMDKLLGAPQLAAGASYDVSFVGSLYEHCLYNKINYLPAYVDGYFNGIMASQELIFGANIVKSSLTPHIIDEVRQYITLDMPADYKVSYEALLTDILNAKITSTNRIAYLNAIAKRFDFTLFTGSDYSLVPRAHRGGTVRYDSEMPQVFRTSKINLNITLASIESGIPLRAIDIMGAGGFLLSNYQPELAEYFENGVDMVLFESKEDMLVKINYYLNHEDERREIAINGYNKVREFYDYKVKVNEMLSHVANNTECHTNLL